MTEQVNKMTAEEIKNLTAMDLLDLEMDMVPESPDYINPPSGIYLASLGIKQGTYDKKVYGEDKKPTGETVEEIKVSSNFKVKQVLEVLNGAKLEGEDDPRVEDMFGVSFFGKTGIQDFVNTFSGMAKELTGLPNPTARQLLEQFANDAKVDVLITVERKSRKKDGETYYNTSIVDVSLAPAAQ